MAGDVALALAVTEEIRRHATSRLPPDAAQALEADLRKIESKLQGSDRYAHVQDIVGFQQQLRQSSGGDQPRPAPAQQQPQQAPPQPPPPAQTAQLGQRVATAVEAIDFPGFVSSLITGTFKAIVDASAAQMREYANLVSSIAHTLEDFTAEYVTVNQARDHLAKEHPKDLLLKLPPAGSQEEPQLQPRPERSGESNAYARAAAAVLREEDWT